MNVIADFQEFLLNEIPLSQAMGLEVLDVGQSCRLKLPLRQNRNNKNTGFAGSLSAAFSLAGWIVAQSILQNDHELVRDLLDEGYWVEIVLKENTTKFLRPLTEDGLIKAFEPAPESVKAFRDNIRKFKMASLPIVAEAVPLIQNTGVCAKFSGMYVAVKGEKTK